MLKDWHEQALAELVSYFEPNEDILGLLLFGSLSKPEFHSDDWSDIDILIVVKDGKMDAFFPTVAWIKDLGKLWAYDQSSHEFRSTTRACFENFNRIDFVFTTEATLAKMNQGFAAGVKVLFSRSEIVDDIARRTYHQEMVSISQEQFLELVRKFRFKSMLAVYKVLRNDLLIALHLAQDLVRDCCMLGMLLRDRATGTNLHKDGGMGNQLVKQLESTQRPFTSAGILDSVKASNEVFEALAHEWSEDHQDHRQFLFDWIEKARAELQV